MEPTGSSPSVSRRQAWRVAAVGATGATGALVLAPAPAEAKVARRATDKGVARMIARRASLTRRAVERIVDQRLAAFEERLLSSVLPDAVEQDPVRSRLDARYALVGSLPLEPVGDTVAAPVVLSQAAYDALPSPDADTLYVIVD